MSDFGDFDSSVDNKGDEKLTNIDKNMEEKENNKNIITTLENSHSDLSIPIKNSDSNNNFSETLNSEIKSNENNIIQNDQYFSSKTSTPDSLKYYDVYDPWQGKPNNIVSDSYDENMSERINSIIKKNKEEIFSNEDMNEEEIINNPNLSDAEKTYQLQGIFTISASNGMTEKVLHLLKDKKYLKYINIDKADEEGTNPLIYACCLGHEDIVKALLDAGAQVDIKDKYKWTPLMWATNTHHKDIVKLLLSHGASPTSKNLAGRTPIDYVSHDGDDDISNAIRNSTENNDSSTFASPDNDSFTNANQSFNSNSSFENNNNLNSFTNPSLSTTAATAAAAVSSASKFSVPEWYSDIGIQEAKLQDQLEENELRHRLLLESSVNNDLNVSSLKLNDSFEDEIEDEDVLNMPEFDWNHCLPDQMYVFSESEIPFILEAAIISILPQRSRQQKPIPANMIFLCARYAFYIGTEDLFHNLLDPATKLITQVVQDHKQDPAFIAFWLSNVTLLLYYFRKDSKLSTLTTYLEQFENLLNDIYRIMCGDAIRLLDKVLDEAILTHETIPGLVNVQFRNEWRFFKRKPKLTNNATPDSYLPPNPKKKAEPAPRLVTSILSSVLFICDLYDIHPYITFQIIAQLFYWINAALFNRILLDKKYLARTRAMQIRLNLSTIEDWARFNNRAPLFTEESRKPELEDNFIELSRKHFSPLVQLLQWLQCLSTIGNDLSSLIDTMQQLKALTPEQLLYVVNHYRPEVQEKLISPNNKNYLISLDKDYRLAAAAKSSSTKKQITKFLRKDMRENIDSDIISQSSNNRSDVDNEVNDNKEDEEKSDIKEHSSPTRTSTVPSSVDLNQGLLLDAAKDLPFNIPTYMEMVNAWGSGIDGSQIEKARKYQPSVSNEFVNKLDHLTSNNISLPPQAKPLDFVQRSWDKSSGLNSSSENKRKALQSNNVDYGLQSQWNTDNYASNDFNDSSSFSLKNNADPTTLGHSPW